MSTAPRQPRRYEEHAYVIDFDAHGRSCTVRGKEGPIVAAIGGEHLTLLEVLGVQDSAFEVGEKIFIGKEGRTKVLSVLGKMTHDSLRPSAQGALPGIVEQIVIEGEPRFVEYLNRAGALTRRVHALELIPGIGKTYLQTLLEERDRQKFQSYDDLQERVGLKSPVMHIAQRIMDEITSPSRMNIFVKR